MATKLGWVPHLCVLTSPFTLSPSSFQSFTTAWVLDLPFRVVSARTMTFTVSLLMGSLFLVQGQQIAFVQKNVLSW